MDDQSQKTYHIFGIPILGLDKSNVVKLFVRAIESGGKNQTRLVFTPNPEQIRMTWADPQFAHCLSQSTWNIPDGSGLVWAIKRKYGVKAKKLTRVSGREIFHDLLQIGLERGWRVFFLGGKGDLAYQLVAKYEEAKNSRSQAEFYGEAGAWDIREETKLETQRVLASITKAKPHVLFVSYGAPYQEQWLIKNREVLSRAGVKLAMVVGGAFAYEAGQVPRVPKIIEHIHAEWLWRLAHEPWRAKRQLQGLEFFLRCLFHLDSA